MHRITLASEEDTKVFAGRLASACRPGQLVALVGDLGAGKTRLVRSAAIALGAAPQAISSPTFVLIQEYEARIPVYHFDAYRLGGADEFRALGSEEYFEAGGICFVEWADRVREALPEDMLQIELAVLAETRRLATIQASGPRSNHVLARLIAAGGGDGPECSSDEESVAGGRR